MLCGTDVTCGVKAMCINGFLEAENRMQGFCRCLDGLADLSIEKNIYPGEVCEPACDDEFCVHGDCEIDVIYFNRTCSCAEWFVGVKCTWDLRILIWMALAVVIVGILFAAIILYRKRRTVQLSHVDSRESDLSSSLQGDHDNYGYLTLRRNDVVQSEGEGSSWDAVPAFTGGSGENRLQEIPEQEQEAVRSSEEPTHDIVPITLPRAHVSRSNTRLFEDFPAGSTLGINLEDWGRANAMPRARLIDGRRGSL